jgi:hypothetical protein
MRHVYCLHRHCNISYPQNVCTTHDTSRSLLPLTYGRRRMVGNIVVCKRGLQLRLMESLISNLINFCTFAKNYKINSKTEVAPSHSFSITTHFCQCISEG